MFQNARLRFGDGTFDSEEDAAVGKTDRTTMLKLVPFVGLTRASSQVTSEVADVSDRTVARPDESDAGHALLSELGGSCFFPTSRSFSQLRQCETVIVLTAQSLADFIPTVDRSFAVALALCFTLNETFGILRPY